MPTAAVVAGPEPDMAPKKTQDRTVEMARPPGIGPTKASATATSLRDMPEASIRAPASTKAGRAMSGKAVREAKALSIIIERSMSRIKKQAMVPTPRATMIGQPTRSSRKNIRKSIPPMPSGVISVALLPCHRSAGHSGFPSRLLDPGRQFPA